MEGMHKDACARTEQNLGKQRVIHNSKTKVTPLNLRENNYVLVKKTFHCKHKLEHKWKGRKIITKAVSDLVLEAVGMLERNRDKSGYTPEECYCTVYTWRVI